MTTPTSQHETHTPADGAPARGAVDIAHSRSSFSLKHRLGRFAWGVVQATLFRWSPRPLWAWRAFLVRCFGGQVHPSARLCQRVRIWAPWNLVMGEYATIGDDVDVYSVDRIELGAQAIVSQYSYLCGATHDFEQPTRPLVPKPIVIGAQCWIAADVFVAPGVTISEGVVVGARSSVFSDLPAWTVCHGTPAKPVRERQIHER